jgi:hypothetical protein
MDGMSSSSKFKGLANADMFRIELGMKNVGSSEQDIDNS